MNPPTPAENSVLSAPTASSEPRTHASFHLFSYVLGLLTALLLVGGSLLLLRRPEPPPIVIQPPPTPLPTAAPQPSPTPGPITVFVSGAVARPGLYELGADGRVGTALELAGGLTDGADAAVVNQAELLWDGAQIHVPSRAAPGAAPAAVAPGAQSSAPPLAANGPPAGVSGSSTMANRSGAIELASNLININLATAAELETLPGIGPSKAAAILANRPYATVDDLVRVPGIGEKTVEQLRAYVAVQ